MKNIFFFTLILLLASSLLHAQEDYPLDVNMSGPNFYNVLRISSFDVKNSSNQPVFFTVRTTNSNHESIDDVWVYFTLSWNGQDLINPNTKSRYRNSPMAPGETFMFTNREIFSETASFYFSTPQPNISVSTIINQMPDLRDTILNTGLFPDGSYQLTIQFKNETGTLDLSGQHSINFTVRNPGGIFLIRPGTTPGATIPSISGSPINFLWSSNLGGTQYGNTFTLTVKEFDEREMLSQEFIETSGNTILNASDIQTTYYSDFINFRENRFYAWQVSTELFDPAAGSFTATSEIKSPYFVFRYSSEADSAEDTTLEELNAFLLNLNIPGIAEFLGEGFSPTGVIEYNGEVYTGSDALNLIQNLLNRTVISFTITD
jgi:hypothetical protein